MFHKDDLIAVDGAVDSGVEIRGLVVIEPVLMNVVGVDVGGTWNQFYLERNIQY